jgi:hypothetical protein
MFVSLEILNGQSAIERHPAGVVRADALGQARLD